MICNVLLMLALPLAGQTSQPAQFAEHPLERIRVELSAPKTTVNVGDPVWLDFRVRNTGEDPVELTVPEAALTASPPGLMGLPIEHVFSGRSWQALAVIGAEGKRVDDDVRRAPDGPVAPVRVAGRSSVGIRLDVASWYPSLRQTGRYVLRWSPYGGSVASGELQIRVEQLRRVVIETDLGRMDVELLYDKAPLHVANFLELVESGLYNDTTLWRVVNGALVQGGDPAGDGSGARPDGRKLEPEFNDTLFVEGTFGMALVPGDPSSASCQFLIALRRLPFLDGTCTAFARCVGPESLRTLRRIGSVATDSQDQPIEPIRVRRMTVELVGGQRLLKAGD